MTLDPVVLRNLNIIFHSVSNLISINIQIFVSHLECLEFYFYFYNFLFVVKTDPCKCAHSDYSL